MPADLVSAAGAGADLDAIEGRLKAATPGRWMVEGLRVMRGTTAVCTLPLNYNGPAPADARFIAHAPTDIAALLVEVRALARTVVALSEDFDRQAAEIMAAYAALGATPKQTVSRKLSALCGDVVAERAAAIAERDNAVMSAAVGEAVVAALHGEEVSDFMQSFGPVMEAQTIGHTARLLQADRDALWRAIKDACGWLRVTDDAEEDWPKLPEYAKQIVSERDALAEREAATNAWLAEVGHLSLAAVGAELAHLREREARLTRILACERGEWAPEGWKWRRIRDEAWVGFDDDDGVRAWCRGRSTRVVRSARTGRWTAWTLMPGMCDCWDAQADKDHAPTALEAIEAADAAAREVSGG